MTRSPGLIPGHRVEALLATKRIAPSNRSWGARINALHTARRLGPAEFHERLSSEINAMWAERRDAMEREVSRTREVRRVEEAAMLNCRYRHPLVRGLTTFQCKAKRMCFLCAGPLPPRRMHWCSDRCVNLWTSNHEWGAASHAARRRDQNRCVRCGSDGVARRVCIMDGQPWPCAIPDRILHNLTVEKIAMEVNHKRPRHGRGYAQTCAHHLVKLETLCHPCHVIETTRQGRERRGQGHRDATDGGSPTTGALLPSTLNMAAGLSND